MREMVITASRLSARGRPTLVQLREIAREHRNTVRRAMIAGGYTPNTKMTIEKKGDATPLFDTGQMHDHLNFEIAKKGQRVRIKIPRD